MNELEFLTKGAVFLLVFIGIVSLMAMDHKDLSFAEGEWETIEDAFGSETTETIIGEAESDDLPTGEPPVTEESSPWWAGIPIIGGAAQFIVDVGAAIWGFVLTVAEVVRGFVDVTAAIFIIFMKFVTFDIPALRGSPSLRILFVVIIAPFWVGIPYILIKLLRGGG